jgi:hypothetical protein
MNAEYLNQVQEMLLLPVPLRPEKIARLVHDDQLDKALRPYIDHPRRVSQNVQMLAPIHSLSERDEEHLVAAAWLHDVIEDSGKDSFPKVSAEDLAVWGIAPEVIEIVQLLTRPEKDDLSEEDGISSYYREIKAHALARLVKIADMADNCNRQRVKWLEALGKESKVAKYLPALSFFELNQEEKSWFEDRVNSACELDGLDDEEHLKFFVRREHLLCLGSNLIQARFRKSEDLWVRTFDLFDWIIKGDMDLDQISLDESKSRFPNAFPIKMKEGN